jgi:predicted RNA-binding Zn ribbon-like protein
MLVEPMSPDVLVWLVNEWGSVPRATAGEDERPYPDTDLLAALLAGSGVRSCPPEVLASQALSQVADRLHQVFAAADLAERVSLIDGLLTETGVRPALDLTDGRPGETWLVDDARQALAAAAALALRHQLAGHHPARVGVCSGRRCADAYIDASPGGQRRFCSVTCQNRARVAAWRQRRSGPPPELSTAPPARPAVPASSRFPRTS